MEKHIQIAIRRNLLSEIHTLMSTEIISPVVLTSIEYAKEMCGDFITKVILVIKVEVCSRNSP